MQGMALYAMPLDRENPSMNPCTEMRRDDRAKDDTWIRAFLDAAPFGFLAAGTNGERPFLTSNLFVYADDEHALYLHSADAGRTPERLRDPSAVTFSAATVGRVLPARRALAFSIEYGSVIAFGTSTTVSGDEARTALQRLLDKYSPHLQPGRDYRPITDAELARTAVYRVDIEAWSGKESPAAPDFPGAHPTGLPSIPLVPDPTGE